MFVYILPWSTDRRKQVAFILYLYSSVQKKPLVRQGTEAGWTQYTPDECQKVIDMLFDIELVGLSQILNSIRAHKDAGCSMGCMVIASI